MDHTDADAIYLDATFLWRSINDTIAWRNKEEIKLPGKHIRLLRAAKLPNASKITNLVYGLTDKPFLEA